MISLTIDGRPAEAQPGQTILAAAKSLGIEIPTLCYHKAIPAAGACRICVVEVKAGARPGLVPACAYPAQEGLVIETGSKRVLDSRRMTLALLLARSPDAEVIQRLAREYEAEGTGKPPKTVVFLQCIGSREETTGKPYCSKICCMYTARRGLHHAREPDEVRHRQVRPLQRREPVRLQGRPGLPVQRPPAAPPGILNRSPSRSFGGAGPAGDLTHRVVPL